MAVLTEERKHGGIAAPPRWPEPDGGGGGDGEFSSFPVAKARVAMWLVLTSVTMLFAGLTSAYIVLRGVPSWESIAVPPMIWVNTLILAASSVALEVARRALRKNAPARSRQWLGGSAILGMAFLAGQLVLWRELVEAGVYLPSTLHSSFLYVLTGIHGIHLAGGIAALGYILSMSWKGRLTPASHEPLNLVALYWHFMDAVWIYLFLLLILV